MAGSDPPRVSCGPSSTYPIENWEQIRRFWTTRVIRIDLGIGDDIVLTNDVASRRRQGPTVLAIELREVSAELTVNLAQIFWRSPANAELCGDRSPLIAQDRETERVLAL